MNTRLRELVEEMFEDFQPENLDEYTKDYRTQLEFELRVIENQGFESIFLICYELCRFARERGIRMGPGRGSAAASLVCFLLGITHLDPIKYNLDFSRFLIEGRVSPPDIDLDIERSGREIILERLKEIVGPDRVAKIATFARSQNRAALKDASRVLMDEDFRYKKLKRDIHIICNMVPLTGKVPLADLVKREPLRGFYQRYPLLFKLAARFVGLPRQPGVHAAGVVLGSKPIGEMAPMYKNAKDPETKMRTLQWEMGDTERLGLFKLDLLVLDALDFISECCEMAEIQVDGLEPTDPAVFEAFAKGHTTGIFQFDRGYVGEIFQKIGCDSFDDLVATNALLRPGAKATNSVALYAQNKNKTTVEATLPKAAHECVAETYGLILYQEQAMKIARVCAGFSVSQADDLRKGIAKDYDTSRVKVGFLKGCQQQGLSDVDAQQLWKVLENAGRYMFNKAHSVCYSYISYIMMWLKVHHPIPFWVAMLNVHIDDETIFKRIIRKLRKEGGTIVGIHANRSKAWCWYDQGQKEIVLGFRKIEGVGEHVANELERLRGSKNAEEWGLNVDKRILNKKVREKLVRENIFDCWSKDHEALLALFNQDTGKGPKIDEMYDENQLGLGI